MRRELLRVAGVEAVGPYSCCASRAAGSSPGAPGQFFMLEAPGRPLPRPFSLCTAAEVELGFLLEPLGPGTTALAGLRPGDAIHVTRPAGQGSTSTSRARCSWAAGSGSRRSRTSRSASARRPRSSGSAPRTTRRRRRSSRTRPSCSTRCSSPTRSRPTRATSSPAAPSRCSTPSHGSCRGAQLAREAPMACGYGACYGCVVERDGALRPASASKARSCREAA